MDLAGSLADWWMLNMLRTISDGVIVGAKTMQAEVDYTCHIFDANLLNDRLNNNMPGIPWNIIVSIDGSDIPFDHIMLQHPAVPVMIATSAKGLETIRLNLIFDYQLVDLNDPSTDFNIRTTNKKPVIVVISGQAMPDSRKLMQFLANQGLKRVLVESPTYMHHLIGLEMMDELFMSYSCVYLGGNALSLGMNGVEFTSTHHPHTRLLELRSHSEHFFYLRHQLVYRVGK
jgi:riboflavin biosynthesis pyrimidine reductase